MSKTSVDSSHKTDISDKKDLSLNIDASATSKRSSSGLNATCIRSVSEHRNTFNYSV